MKGSEITGQEEQQEGSNEQLNEVDAEQKVLHHVRWMNHRWSKYLKQGMAGMDASEASELNSRMQEGARLALYLQKKKGYL